MKAMTVIEDHNATDSVYMCNIIGFHVLQTSAQQLMHSP